MLNHRENPEIIASATESSDICTYESMDFALGIEHDLEETYKLISDTALKSCEYEEKSFSLFVKNKQIAEENQRLRIKIIEYQTIVNNSITKNLIPSNYSEESWKSSISWSDETISGISMHTESEILEHSDMDSNYSSFQTQCSSNCRPFSEKALFKSVNFLNL